MKKLFALVLALTLCLSATAFAAIPSPRPLPIIDKVIKAVAAEDFDDAQKAAYETELAKINDALDNGDVADYFAVEDDLKALVGADALTVSEFNVITTQDTYADEEYPVTVTLLFNTEYEEGTKVAVLISVVTVNIDDTTSVEWTVLEGTVTDAMGHVAIEVEKDLAEAISSNTALLAVVSAEIAEDAE